MPTFTPQQRKDITRRQLNIAIENQAYTNSSAGLQTEKVKLLNVDNANKSFYDIHDLRAESYENEGRAQNGSIPATYTEGQIDPYVPGDLSTSAKTPGATAAIFFPNTPPYVNYIPKVINQVKGFLFPTGTDARYELNILTNAVVTQGLTELIFRLSNGISGGATTTTSDPIPAGTVVGLTVLVTSSTGFSPGQLVYINNGSASGIYQITATASGPDSITISSVIPSLLGIGSGATVDNDVPAFTPTERQTLVSTLYQEILTNITNGIASVIAEWELKIDTQIAQLNANNEDRGTQVAQNAVALADVNNTKLIIDAWQALPDTGVTGKYTSGSIAPISAEITARQAFIPTRITQITTALGDVNQSGDSYTGVAGSPYFERYKWLNIRINKASGSARRYFAADDGIGFLGMLAADNTAVKNEYDLYFITKAITFRDETPIIHVSNITGYSVGHTLTILSEEQPEITRAIIEILGTNQLRLDKPIPNSYLVSDQARVFRTL